MITLTSSYLVNS